MSYVVKRWYYNAQNWYDNTLWTLIKCSLTLFSVNITRKTGPKYFLQWKNSLFFKRFVFNNLSGRKETIFWLPHQILEYLMNSHRQFTGNCHSRCYAVIGTEVFLYWKNSIFWKKRVFNNVLGPEGMILLLPKQSYWTFIIRSLLFVILDNTWESGQNIFFLLKGSPFVEKNCFYRPFESYRKNVINWTIFMKLLCAHRQTVPQTFVILHDTTRKGQKKFH